MVVPREVLLFVTEETQTKVPVNRQPLMLQKRFWQPKLAQQVKLLSEERMASSPSSVTPSPTH